MKELTKLIQEETDKAPPFQRMAGTSWYLPEVDGFRAQWIMLAGDRVARSRLVDEFASAARAREEVWCPECSD